MESFFDRVAGRWPTGRVDYHWHVLFDPEVTAARLFEPYRELTHRAGLAPVQPNWFHLTLLHSAPTDQLADADLSRIVADVERRCAEIPPFSLVLRPPYPGAVAVECLGAPGERTRELWRAVSAATAEVTGDTFPIVPEVHYPHVALAYATGPADRTELKVWLTERVHPSVTLPVQAISLVAQRHDGREITWAHLLDVPLDGQDSGPGDST